MCTIWLAAKAWPQDQLSPFGRTRFMVLVSMVESGSVAISRNVASIVHRTLRVGFGYQLGLIILVLIKP